MGAGPLSTLVLEFSKHIHHLRAEAAELVSMEPGETLEELQSGGRHREELATLVIGVGSPVDQAGVVGAIDEFDRRVVA